jgi:uncharacterized membrane protein
MQTILFGLASAMFWGAGDFAGGLVSRRVNAIRASLYVQAGGLIPVLAIALFTRQLNMPLVDWLWCSAAGVIGSLGFLALYRALADGQMSTAAPDCSGHICRVARHCRRREGWSSILLQLSLVLFLHWQPSGLFHKWGWCNKITAERFAVAFSCRAGISAFISSLLILAGRVAFLLRLLLSVVRAG